MSKPITIAATAQWAYLVTRNDMSGKYQIDLTQLSDAAVEALEANGITVSDKEDKGRNITVKSQHPIKAYGTDGVEIHDAIGNGSKVKATISYYDWNFKGKSGRSPSLMKLIVTDLEVYEAVDEIDYAAEEAL